ncbi:hypothetical protein ACFL6S_36635 [Candidatus Poribacteria bacterium]
MGEFVSIRMIVVRDEDKRDEFGNWITKTFLNAMGDLFKPNGSLFKLCQVKGECPDLDQNSGLERIIFLKGNKEEEGVPTSPHPLKSDEHATKRGESSEAGANADYAWITFWTSREANKAAWSCQYRPNTWYNDARTGHWNKFQEKCFPKPGRPPHGPPYDYLGVSTTEQRGSGAGCLVEGFEIIYDEDEKSHLWT